MTLNTHNKNRKKNINLKENFASYSDLPSKLYINKIANLHSNELNLISLYYKPYPKELRQKKIQAVREKVLFYTPKLEAIVRHITKDNDFSLNNIVVKEFSDATDDFFAGLWSSYISEPKKYRNFFTHLALMTLYPFILPGIKLFDSFAEEITSEIEFRNPCFYVPFGLASKICDLYEKKPFDFDYTVIHGLSQAIFDYFVYTSKNIDSTTEILEDKGISYGFARDSIANLLVYKNFRHLFPEGYVLPKQNILTLSIADGIKTELSNAGILPF